MFIFSPTRADTLLMEAHGTPIERKRKLSFRDVNKDGVVCH